MSRIIFITGTDTGVGKTVLTALLLHHYRSSGVNALAMKPVCSGGLEDVRLIQALQNHALAPDEVNPFHFTEPVAPLVAARKQGRIIHLDKVISAIRCVARRCELLLVEGAGGVLVPIGESFMIADLIVRLKCDVVVVARNRLGAINHTNLTVEALRSRRIVRLKVVLMNKKRRDKSADTNFSMLKETIENIEVFEVPDLGCRPSVLCRLKNSSRKIKKTLARIGDPDSFASVVRGAAKRQQIELTEKRKSR